MSQSSTTRTSKTSTRPLKTKLKRPRSEILDQATAARSIVELKAEIETLKGLESLALKVRRGGDDRKWRELASLLSEIFTPAGLATGGERSTSLRFGLHSTPGPLAASEDRHLHRTQGYAQLPVHPHHDTARS